MLFGKLLSTIALALSFSVAPTFVHAEESLKEQAAEAGRDVKKGTKKTIRKIKDKTCEMVNGKMECAKDRVKHGIQNATDEVKDKTDMDAK